MIFYTIAQLWLYDFNYEYHLHYTCESVRALDWEGYNTGAQTRGPHTEGMALSPSYWTTVKKKEGSHHITKKVSMILVTQQKHFPSEQFSTQQNLWHY